jgi:formylglycine-generating enzyme required for sulfatase activity
VGTWPGAKRVDCKGDPAPGEVCVPGGAYWMGNVGIHGADYAADRLRLVVLSPFFLMDHEITLGEFQKGGGNLGKDVVLWSATATPDALAYYCTPGRADQGLPLNCVNYPAAIAFCQRRGGDLPSEAQHEYVSGAITSARYPWGHDVPTCDDAVWGMGGGGTYTQAHANTCLASAVAKKLTTAGGAFTLPADASARLGTRGRDHLALGGGVVWDLAGNLSEWTKDGFAPQTDPCWTKSDTNVFTDPVCPQRTSDPQKSVSVRGGSWLDAEADLQAASRYSRATDNGSGGLFGYAHVGFRCARSAAQQ